MRSIRNSTTLGTILIVGLIMAVGQIVVDRLVSSWLSRQFDTALESKARALVTLTRFDGAEVELDFADEFMPEFESAENPEYFELFLNDGELLERSRSFAGFSPSVYRPQADVLVFADLVLADGRRGRQVGIVFVPQIEDKSLRPKIPLEARPVATLRVARERESLDRERWRFHWLIFGIAVATLAAVAIGVYLTIGRGLQPLLRIREDVGRISPRSINRRVLTEGQPPELEPIAAQFNLVLAEIEKAFTRERQFSADVAHELRTPVSEIRSLAEVGLRWPDEEDVRGYFVDIHESSERLDRLIDNLLHLCRNEEGDIEQRPEPIDLGDELERIGALYEPQRGDREILVDGRGPVPVMVLADRHILERLLENLVHNAVSHSPDGSRIDVTIESDRRHAGVTIVNVMLEPLTGDDIESLFRRFWRKDSSREGSDHAGIGLSLAESYARLLGFRLNADLTPDGRFRIRLRDLAIAERPPPA